MHVRANSANGQRLAPNRAIEVFRSYADTFGPAFGRAVDRAERRGAGLPAETPERPVVEKLVTKTVIKDGWRAKAKDAGAMTRAAQDQLKAALRDLAKARELADVRAHKLAEALAEARNATDEASRLRAALASADERVEALRDERDEALAMDVAAKERAMVHNLVRLADARAEQAELRAARAEREMAEHGAAVHGEVRKLTVDELNELKANGPAGPAVLGAALKKLARARTSGGKGLLNEALLEVARAALHWRERL